jgi:hypothetical protein
MIKFPSKHFVKTIYPGYFWNIEEQKLYSIKSGVLKPLKFQKGGMRTTNNFITRPGYKVSINNTTKFVSLTYLKTLDYKKKEKVDVYQESLFQFVD